MIENRTPLKGKPLRLSGQSVDEARLDLGGWKSRVMLDRYTKFGTEHLALAAARIECGKSDPPTPSHQGKSEPRTAKQEKEKC